MPRAANPKRILLVTGLSGAGKTTALKTLEDLGWEVIDSLLVLLNPLLAAPLAAGAERKRPLAIGLDSRTRGFDAEGIVRQIKELGKEHRSVETLYLDCQTPELLRRYSETRRRHPLAPDRPATDGIAEEREMTRRSSAGRTMSSTPPTAIQHAAPADPQPLRRRRGAPALT